MIKFLFFYVWPVLWFLAVAFSLFIIAAFVKYGDKKEDSQLTRRQQ